LDPSEDVDDIELVKLANPAPWHTVAKLKRRHDSPSTTPWQWRRFACGIWTEGEEPWIDPQAWDVLADPALELEPFEEVWLGVDVGVRKDSTGIAIVAGKEDKLAVTARILQPPVKGGLPLETVENEIRQLCQEYRVRGVVYDPWSFRRSAELLEDEGIKMIEWPQSPEKMAACSATLYRLINAGELVHNGDLQLRAQVMAGVVKETERGWRLHKDPKRRPIDALIALAMAAQLANDLKPSIYEDREALAV
jgi:phage terminase large subunit-like protein